MHIIDPLCVFSNRDCPLSSQEALHHTCGPYPRPPPCPALPIPDEQGRWLGLPQVKWGQEGGQEGRLGEQSSVRKQNRELNFSQRPEATMPRGEGPGGTSCCFFLIRSSTF